MKDKKIKFESARIYLRPFKITDLDDFYEYASVDGVGEMAGWRHHKNIEHSKIVLGMLIKSKNTYGVILKSEDKLIGSISINKRNEIYELGYTLSKKYWNRGLMSESIKIILSYCFNELNIPELYCSYYSDNKISKHINEKFGFSIIGKDVVDTLGLGKKERVLTLMKNPAFYKSETLDDNSGGSREDG